MPRQRRETYRQTTLTNFLSSSPPSSSPARPTRRSSQSQAKRRLSTNLDLSPDTYSHLGTNSPQREERPIFQAVLGSDGSNSESDVDRIQFEPQRDTSGTNASMPKKPQAVTKKHRAIVISDDDEGTSVTKTGESSSAPLKQKRKSTQQILSSDDSDIELVPRRRVRKRTEPSVSDDDDDIMDGIENDKIVSTKLRRRQQKTNFQRNLEKLKRRKHGQKLPESEAEGDQSDDSNFDVDPFPDARPDRDDDEGSQSVEELDDFIVDDSDGDNSRRAVALPAAFSMDAHQDLAHHFKIICQYFVHLALASTRNKSRTSKQLLEDEYFSVPLEIVRRKLDGVRDSIASSKWRPSFTKALKSSPEFHITSLNSAVPYCDACHLGGRMSTFIGRLDGKPYDTTTFQTLEDASSSESGGEDEEDEKREFHLGRFCARRTKVYHSLCHWEYILYTQLQEEMKYLDRSNRFRANASDSQGEDSGERNGDEYMEKLDQRGVINEEWKKIRELMEGATTLDVEAD